MIIEFHHGALADAYEKQANDQGFTFGENAKFVQDVGFGLVAAHIHGCITDAQWDKILQKFQKKILLNYIKKRGEQHGSNEVIRKTDPEQDSIDKPQDLID